MHSFLDAMKRCDFFHTARDKTVISTLLDLYMCSQIRICVVKLETCPMRAITVAMDLARVVTRQCAYIVKIYSVLIFPLVTLLHRSLARSLCERTLSSVTFFTFVCR